MRILKDMRLLAIILFLVSSVTQAQTKFTFTATAIEYRKTDSAWSNSTEFKKGSQVTIDYQTDRITIKGKEGYEFKIVEIVADTVYSQTGIYLVRYALQDKDGDSVKGTLLIVPPSWFLLTIAYPDFQYRFYLTPIK